MPTRKYKREELIGERVAVYRNLRTGNFSVQRKGLVVAHLEEIHLTDVEFRVSQAGRNRVLEEQQKNVHAKVWGTFVDEVEVEGLPVRYNPYKTETFECASEPIFEADSCILKDNKVWV